MSNEWLLTDQEIEDICVKAIYSAPDNELVKDVRLTASQAIARAQLRHVAEQLRGYKVVFRLDLLTDPLVSISVPAQDYLDLLQEAGLEVKDA